LNANVSGYGRRFDREVVGLATTVGLPHKRERHKVENGNKTSQ